MAQSRGAGIHTQACRTPEPECLSGRRGRLGTGRTQPRSSEKDQLLWVVQLRMAARVLCFSKSPIVGFLNCQSLHRCILLLPAVEVPQVTVQPPATVQKPGGTVILGCVAEPPGVSTSWRLNGEELNGSDDALGFLISRGTLVITALNNRTVGRYQCVARMPAGAVASVPATVTLASECCPFASVPRCSLSFLPSPPFSPEQGSRSLKF